MREGLMPILLGTGVTAAGTALRTRQMRNRKSQNSNMLPMLAAGAIGFGLAHVLLGSIDIFEDMR